MKTTRITLIALVCGVAAVAAAQGGTKAAISAIYAKMDALTLKKDIPGLKKLMMATTTKDATFVDDKGAKKSASEVMDGMASQMTMMSKIAKSTTHIDSLTEKSGTATLATTSVLAFTVANQGASHTVIVNSKSLDVWVKSGGSWKMKSSKLTKQTGTMDGKPIPLNG